MIQRQIGTYVGSSSLTIFNDLVLEQPSLQGVQIDGTGTFYQDNSEICAFLGVPLVLKWNVVTNATYYIVQTCRNSSFIGPTLRTAKITAPTAQCTFYAGQQLWVEVEYYWRVFALNITGGASPKSEAWNFKLSCGTWGKAEDQLSSISSGVSSSSSESGPCENGFVKKRVLTSVYCQGQNVYGVSEEICVKETL